jgi:SAM-dependent methyltransferase
MQSILWPGTFPNSRFTGYDISKEGIETAREEAKQMGLTNVKFEVRDVASINEHEKYDLITAFDVIHDQAQPAKVLKGIYNALRNKQEGEEREGGGIFLMQDMAASSKLEENMENPLSPTLYSISTMHCMTVSLAYNGEGLGTVWGRQKAEEMLKEAGFSKDRSKGGSRRHIQLLLYCAGLRSVSTYKTTNKLGPRRFDRKKTFRVETQSSKSWSEKLFARKMGTYLSHKRDIAIWVLLAHTVCANDAESLKTRNSTILPLFLSTLIICAKYVSKGFCVIFAFPLMKPRTTTLSRSPMKSIISNCSISKPSPNSLKNCLIASLPL